MYPGINCTRAVCRSCGKAGGDRVGVSFGGWLIMNYLVLLNHLMPAAEGPTVVGAGTVSLAGYLEVYLI